MTITLNGQQHTVAAPATIYDLLTHLGFGGRPVVVEHNRKALLPREHPTSAVNDGDVIEIVQIPAGG